MTTTKTPHPYFIDKARRIFAAAGGDPDNSGPLAEWAHRTRTAHRDGADPDAPRRGVIVARDGEVLAETMRIRSLGHVSASYVTELLDERVTYSLARGREVGLAVEAMRRHLGTDVLPVSFAEVCTGPGAV